MNKYEKDFKLLNDIRLKYLSGGIKVEMRILENNYKELVERFSNLPNKKEAQDSLNSLWACSDDMHTEQANGYNDTLQNFINTIYGSE